MSHGYKEDSWVWATPRSLWEENRKDFMSRPRSGRNGNMNSQVGEVVQRVVKEFMEKGKHFRARSKTVSSNIQQYSPTRTESNQV